MRMLVKCFFALAAICSLAALVGGSMRLPSAQNPDAGKLSPERISRVKPLYGEKCARCHGEDGHGHTKIGEMLGVPDFTDKKWHKANANDERLAESITDGKNDMPAFGRKLTKQNIRALVGYVRNFAKPAH